MDYSIYYVEWTLSFLEKDELTTAADIGVRDF